MISDDELVSYVNPATTDDLPELRRLEKAAVASVQKKTGRFFGAEDEVVETLGYNGIALALSNEPAGGAITSLEQWDGSAWTVVGATNYYVRGSFIFWNSSTVPWTALTATAQFRATYDGGYAALDDPEAVDAPEDIRQAVLLFVTYYFDNRDGLAFDDFQRAFDSLIGSHARIAV